MGITSFTLSTLNTGRRKLQQWLAHRATADHFVESAREFSSADSTQHRAATANSADTATGLVALTIAQHTSNVCTQSSVQPLCQQLAHEKWSFTLPPTRLLAGYCAAPVAVSPNAVHLGFASQKPASERALTASVNARTKRSVTNVKRLSGTGNGRLVIAGRMADVCAELDRLVACEALGYAA